METIDAKAFLIDLDGVLYVDKNPIFGAKETLARLEEMGYRYRFISNTTSKSRRTLATFLAGLGFEIPEEKILTPAVVAAERLRSEMGRRCFFITRRDVLDDFEDAGVVVSDEKVDYVVVGDAEADFTYERLNRAFRLVMDGSKMIALEKDRHWMGAEGLKLAAGPFVSALEYASGVEAEVVGKPSPQFFEVALRDLGASAEEAAMIGDDVTSDVGGAKAAGMMGILVRTGKYRAEAVDRSGIVPDLILGSIAELLDHI